MKFLPKLVISGGILGCLAFTPYSSTAALTEGIDSRETPSLSLVNPLSPNTTITNPYNNNPDKPFEIVEAPANNANSDFQLKIRVFGYPEWYGNENSPA